MINLKAEIIALLTDESHKSFNQIMKHVKVPAGYVVDAIADAPEIKECGKYYNSDTESILNYYTLQDNAAELTEKLKEKQQLRQIGLLISALNSEIKTHTGVNASVKAAYEYIKDRPFVNSDLKYFLLEKDHFLFAYRVALCEITIPVDTTPAQHYKNRFAKAA